MKTLILIPGTAAYVNPNYIVSVRNAPDNTCYIEIASSEGIERLMSFSSITDVLKALS